MQRVAIFHLGQTADHKQTWIFRTQELDLADPVQEFLTLLIRWLLVRVFRRHIVRLHDRHRLLPPFGRRSLTGLLERWSEVDSTTLPILPMTTHAVGIDKRGDYL